MGRFTSGAVARQRGRCNLSDDTEPRVKADSECCPVVGAWSYVGIPGPGLCGVRRALCSNPVPAARVIPVAACNRSNDTTDRPADVER
ncbi:hypothetical protein NN3_21620 [Nocardia neocaledoniensis NBRC 108232]|nr:hypothetical protein NN3_21620 [Nocardia neocaledoniensis NBRC 108232]